MMNISVNKPDNIIQQLSLFQVNKVTRQTFSHMPICKKIHTYLGKGVSIRVRSTQIYNLNQFVNCPNRSAFL